MTVTSLDVRFLTIMTFTIPIGILFSTQDEGMFLLLISLPVAIVTGIVWCLTNTESSQHSFSNVRVEK